MLSLLITYCDASGPTEQIARKLGQMLSDEGYLVSFAPVDAPASNSDGYDAVMLVTSLAGAGEGGNGMRWAQRHAAGLAGSRTALVTAGDVSPEAASEAVRTLARSSGWRANANILVTDVPSASDYAALAHWFATGVVGATPAPSVVSAQGTADTLVDLGSDAADRLEDRPVTGTQSGV